MNNKAVGTIFCLIATILTSVRYLSAAIFMSGTATWSTELFQNSLSYVGSTLQISAIAALIVGICFLVWGVLKDGKSAGK